MRLPRPAFDQLDFRVDLSHQIVEAPAYVFDVLQLLLEAPIDIPAAQALNRKRQDPPLLSQTPLFGLHTLRSARIASSS